MIVASTDPDISSLVLSISFSIFSSLFFLIAVSSVSFAEAALALFFSFFDKPKPHKKSSSCGAPPSNNILSFVVSSSKKKDGIV